MGDGGWCQLHSLAPKIRTSDKMWSYVLHPGTFCLVGYAVLCHNSFFSCFIKTPDITKDFLKTSLDCNASTFKRNFIISSAIMLRMSLQVPILLPIPQKSVRQFTLLCHSLSTSSYSNLWLSKSRQRNHELMENGLCGTCSFKFPSAIYGCFQK